MLYLMGNARLRLEVFGPLGQSVMALVWDGRDIFLRKPDHDRVERSGQEGFAQFFGKGLEIRDLCALLSGNIPELAQPYDAAQFCGQSNTDCFLEIRQGSLMRRVWVAYSVSSPARDMQVVSQELYQAGNLIYRVRFKQPEIIASYHLPLKIEIENLDDNLKLTIEYSSEIEINIPLSDDIFSLADVDVGK